MLTIRRIFVACTLSLLLPVATSAQSLSELQSLSPEDRRNYIESMSEEERAAKREQWRAEYDQLSEEEKEAIQNRRRGQRGGEHRNREAMQERWNSMSEEEKAAAREERRANAEKRRAEWDAMSEEERAAARERRAASKGQRKDGPHGGSGKPAGETGD